MVFVSFNDIIPWKNEISLIGCVVYMLKEFFRIVNIQRLYFGGWVLQGSR